MIDTNQALRAYLAADAGIIALFAPAAPRIYCPRLPENADLPAIGFFTRGGSTTPYIPGLLMPSVQIDCWADDPIEARQIYRSVYDALQGIQDTSLVIGATTYYILSAREEVQGQDLMDEIPGYYRVLSFWEIQMR